MAEASDLLTLVRPRQWTKNIVVFAAIIFAGELTSLGALEIVSVAFVSLCFVSSALFALNDAVDAERDRVHPRKRERPVASGRISVRAAYGASLVLGAIGIVIAWTIHPMLLVGVALYGALQLAYIVWLKNVVLVDVMVIAAGLVIRAVAGAWVIEVPVSPWLVVCVGLLGLFLATAKRRHEIVLLGEGSGGHRPVLEEYSAELLDSLMVTLAAATVTSYSLYTFFATTEQDYAMMLTIPFVIYGVLRYQYLVLRRDQGGSPEDVLLGDVPMIVNIALWVAASVAVIYVLWDGGV